MRDAYGAFRITANAIEIVELETFRRKNTVLMTPESVDSLRTAESRRYDAMRLGDVSLLETLLADELVYIHSNGVRDTKETYLARLRGGSLRYLDLNHEEELVEVIDATGLVVGRMIAKASVSGQEISLANHHLAVWIHREVGWELLAYYPSDRVEPRREHR